MLGRCIAKARLNKQHKSLTNLYSLSHLTRTIPTIHHCNIRLIQSIIHNNTYKCIKSSFNPSYNRPLFNKLPYFNPLQIFNKRSFSLPEHEVIGLPALSPSVEESKIVSWKANEGDFISADTAIASVQTDKAELDWMVTDDVYLAKILLEPNIQVPVGTPACIFVEDKSHINAFKNYSSNTATTTTTTTESQTISTPTPPSPSQPSQSTVDTSKYPDHRIEGMPALSPTAIDGALVEWLVKEGDMIEEGTGIAEIQTDKSVVTWTSTDEAYIAKLLVPVAPDNKLLVGTPLAIIVDEKNDISAFKDYIVGATPTPTPTPIPTKSESKKDTSETASSAGRQPSIQFRHGVTDTPTPKQTIDGSFNSKIFASPYAKKLAKEMNISLDNIGIPTGPNNRIVAADIIKASQQQQQQQQAIDVFSSNDRSYEDIAVSVMREIIGQRLSESKFTSPHFYVTMECLMDNLIAIREECNMDEDNKISINDFIIKACAYALRDTPNCNVGWIIK
eukprot:935462_1